jgi:molybdopterin molybdotransferase
MPELGVEQALTGLLESLQPLPPEALGLVLAQAVLAGEDHPADDTSAMDGYAVHDFALRHASPDQPVRLEIIEDIQAGYPPEREIREGECSRISTGGLIPVGATAVEMREYVTVEDDVAIFTRPLPAKSNIRFAGEHLRAGEEVLSPGTVLSSAELGMAAYLGVHELLCRPRLKVAILATGSELVEQGAELGRGQVRDSNGVALAGAVRQLGCSVVHRQRVADQAEALDQAIAHAVQQGAGILLTSGGISAGWHDLVRERIENSGGRFVFHKLRMRPGKPIAFGRLRDMLVFCLPGNPVSSLVSFEVFVKPALLKLMGQDPTPRTVQATLLEPVRKKRGFTVFFRVRVEDGPEGKTARLSGPQGSHQLKSLVGANGLLVAGEEIEELSAGQQVEVRLTGPL